MAVLKSGRLPEDGQVGLRQVAADCDFNVILNWEEIVNRVALGREMNV